MTTDLQSARSFVQSVKLPRAPAAKFGVTTAETVFETAKNQAVVVGSEVISFVSGVDDKTREAVSDSSLLAQLVAKKKVADPQDIYTWYREYFEVLSNIGWVIQENGFVEYSEGGEGFEVHEAILKVATTLLGPVPGALALITSALEALKTMDEGPWITIFNRESQRAKAAKFQVTLVRKDPQHGLLVEVMAFGVEAKKTVTQVLFFKVKTNKAKLRRNVGKASLNEASLHALLPDIRAKVSKFQSAYISSLPEL